MGGTIRVTNLLLFSFNREGQGLFLDQELQYGKTETCQTFDNPPLCPTGDFKIKVVEVYGINVTSDWT